jgi:hypothetical protein
MPKVARVGSESVKDGSADEIFIERIERRLNLVEPKRWPTNRVLPKELLAQRCAYFFEPLQGAEDLRLIVG